MVLFDGKGEECFVTPVGFYLVEALKAEMFWTEILCFVV